MKLMNIGFGSMIAASRLLAIVTPESAPIKRLIQEARDRGMLIDASYGHKTKTVQRFERVSGSTADKIT